MPNLFSNLEHAHEQALLEATGLTRFAPSLVNLALIVGRTRVLDVALNCALEEGFASLTAGDAVMKPRGNISAYQTQATQFITDRAAARIAGIDAARVISACTSSSSFAAVAIIAKGYVVQITG